MASRKKGKNESGDDSGGLPLGSAFEVVEGLAGMAVKLLAQKYQVEKKVEEIKEETQEKVEELRDEAIRTGYEVKKAFLRTVVEAILLVTGIVSFVVGTMLWASRIIEQPEYILIFYGILVGIYVVFTMKTGPIELSFEAYHKGDLQFFADSLPKSDYYRCALTYPDETIFLDIETTGLSLYYDQITLVGWSIGRKFGVYIKDQDEKTYPLPHLKASVGNLYGWDWCLIADRCILAKMAH